MIKKLWAVSIASTLLVFNVSAETLDGSAILEAEAEKARKIEDLEYQAKLVEQKAKLAKAYKNLHESGGYIPGEGVAPQSAQGGAVPAGSSVAKLEKLPVLRSISGNSALFEWEGNLFRGKPGSELPGGFVVLTVNAAEGVRVKHLNNVYGLDIAW